MFFFSTATCKINDVLILLKKIKIIKLKSHNILINIKKERIQWQHVRHILFSYFLKLEKKIVILSQLINAWKTQLMSQARCDFFFHQAKTCTIIIVIAGLYYIDKLITALSLLNHDKI